MSPIRAYRVMVAMGDKLDQRLLQRFVQVNGIYPIGQIVELDDGQIAIVRGQNADPCKPVLGLVETVEDLHLVPEDEHLIDLSNIACGCARRILCELTPDTAGERLRPAATEPAAAPAVAEGAPSSPLRWN